MPYTINRTNGAKITVVQDGTINNSSLDIVLIGKNYSGYGEAFNENFVKLIENFSNTTRPKKPLSGQLWFDSTSKKIKVYNGSIFKSIGVIETERPQSGSNIGDLYYNPTEKKLYVYDGATPWTLVGPQTISASGISAISITDTNANSHSVIQALVDTTQASIFSATIPKFLVPVSNSFVHNNYPAIYPGINLPGSSSEGVSSYIDANDQRQNYLLWGTAASSLGFVEGNTSGTAKFVPASNYVKRAELTTGTNFPLIVLDDDGVTVGVQRVLKIHVTNSTIGNISNIRDTRIQFNVNTLAGTYTNVINIDGNNGLAVLPSSINDVNLGASGNRFNTLYTKNISAGTTASSGTITGQWSLGNGSTLQATYADLAERYAADKEYDPGTVLIIGGDKEVTTTERRGNTAVAGIVSTNPAYTLNADAGDDITHPYIALKGRVPCYVVGPVSKGDLLVTSSKAGYAERAHANDNPNAVLGRSLENFDGPDGLVEVMVI
jgi:hypothetical protein